MKNYFENSPEEAIWRNKFVLLARIFLSSVRLDQIHSASENMFDSD